MFITYMHNSEPSICIPYVFADVNQCKIKNIFERIFGKGCIKNVIFVKKVGIKGELYNRVFIHFNQWTNTERIQNIRQRLLEGIYIKIVYEEHLFWKCSAVKYK